MTERLVLANNPAFDEDISRIREWKPTLDAPIATLDSEINELLARRDELVALRSQFDSTPSLSRTFPNEVLEQIFLWTRNDRMSVYDMTEGPWLVGRVCRKWRMVALGCPHLWSCFVVRHHDSQVIREPITLLKTVLSRVANVGLEFEYQSARRSFESYDLETTILELLADYSEQWVDVTLVGVTEDRFKGPWSGVRGRLSRLNRLGIEREGPGVDTLNIHTGAHISPVDLFEDVPSLRKVDLFNIHLNDFRFGKGKITGFRIGRFAGPWTLFPDDTPDKVLRACPGLSLLEYREDPDPQPPLIPFTLPPVEHCFHTCLTDLRIFNVDFLESLSAPNLTTLEVGQQHTYTEAGHIDSLLPYMPTVLQFIARSHCSLKSLSLDELDLDCDEFLQVLGFCDGLEELSISYRGVLEDTANVSINNAMSALVCYLTVSMDLDKPSARGLPELKVLRFESRVFPTRGFQGGFTFVNDEFVAMVFSRLAMSQRPQPSCLSVISFKFNSPKPDKALPALKYSSLLSLWQAVDEEDAQLWIDGEFYNLGASDLDTWTLV